MCQMKNYRIYSRGGELAWMKYFPSARDIDLVPVLDKKFSDDNMDNAVKQALCIIIDYLKGFSFIINGIYVKDQYHSNGKEKYIIFSDNNRIQGIFKLEEIE